MQVLDRRVPVLAAAVVLFLLFLIPLGNEINDLHRAACDMVSEIRNCCSTSIRVPPGFVRNYLKSVEIPPHNITIVTLYLNLGSFQKGQSLKYDRNTYVNWLETWGYINNRVIAYFDDPALAERFRYKRRSLPPSKTLVYILSRSQLPAFRNLAKIKKLYANASYPKHHPNTVLAEYSCAMNAKYDVMDWASHRDDLDTKYLAWLDIGLFRDLVPKKEYNAKDLLPFSLEVPEKFNDDTVGYSIVGSTEEILEKTTSSWQLIRHNLVWIAGSYFVGTKQVIQKHVQAYKDAVEDLLRKNESSTDQQVLAALYAGHLSVRPSVSVTTYKCACTFDPDDTLRRISEYFCLGYLCRRVADLRRRFPGSDHNKTLC